MTNQTNPTNIKIGLCGLGVVGQGVIKHLEARNAELSSRLGVSLEVARVAVRDLSKPRDVNVPADRLTVDPMVIVNDPSIQVVCELMGGTDTAREVVLNALKKGKIVITANKALISEHGAEVFAAARSGGGHIFFEASVAGGIPIIKALREGLVANRFRRIYGILNGTCNYILTRMEREGASYEDVLTEAKALGYAEAEESLDVDGWDTAHKAGILAFLAHGKWVGVTEMRVEGIRRINQDDMAFAQAFDYKIKLIAIIERDFVNNELVVRVQPMLLPERLVMANVDEVYNGVCVVGDVVGTTLYIGRGAGQDATSSAVISDIVDAVGVLCSQKPPLIPDEVPGILGDGSDLAISPSQNVTGCYYFRLFVRDEPGVLEQVASIMAKQRVSIASVLQRESDAPDVASLILTTHETNEASIERAVLGLQVADCVLDDPVVLKIADFED